MSRMMRIRPRLHVLAAMLLCAAAAPAAAQEDTLPPPPYPPLDSAAAREVLEHSSRAHFAHNYKDGVEAARWVTRASLDKYTELARLAVYGTEEEVRALPMLDRFPALHFRMTVPLEVLRTLSGDSLFAYLAVVHRAPRMPDPTGGRMYGEGDHVIVRNHGGEVHLRREEGRWKWDWIAYRNLNAAAWNPRPSYMTEDEYLLDSLGAGRDGRPAEAVWQPLLPPPAPAP